MDLFVLVGQRKERHPGEYGLEALACMTEYDQDNNPEYLANAKRENEDTGEFEAIEIVCMKVDEPAVRAVLFPATKPIPVTVAPINRYSGKAKVR
jgi:hypothetical protein